MDPRLWNAARLGDVIALTSLLQDDPLILEKVSLSPISDTPLHIAALAGKTNFVIELIKLKPSFAMERNYEGFTPLHVAAAAGNIEIVRELIKLGSDLCLLKDRGGRCPLHYAAIKGRVDVTQELLASCPLAVKEVTAQGETALHLAVKNSQCDAFKVLIAKNGGDGDGEIVNAKDNEGNTVLQLALASKQLQVLDLLKNQGKLLNKDVIEVVTREQFVSVSDTMPHTSPPDAKIVRQDLTQSKEKQQKGSAQGDSKSIWEEVEEMVLVVASLIASVTYQAGLSPPQTIWKEDMKLDSKCIFHYKSSISSFHTSCPALVAYFLFMSFNTAGFFASVLLIFFFRNRSYVQILLPIALISMMITYITLSVNMSPNALSLLIIYLLTLAIFTYCILAIEVVKRIIHNTFGFAARKVKSIAKSVIKKHKPSTADPLVDSRSVIL